MGGLVAVGVRGWAVGAAGTTTDVRVGSNTTVGVTVGTGYCVADGDSVGAATWT